MKADETLTVGDSSTLQEVRNNSELKGIGLEGLMGVSDWSSRRGRIHNQVAENSERQSLRRRPPD